MPSFADESRLNHRKEKHLVSPANQGHGVKANPIILESQDALPSNTKITNKRPKLATIRILLLKS